MTGEEVIRILECGGWWDLLDPSGSDADLDPLDEAIDVALAALRAQQAPANLDRSRWKGCEMCCIDWSTESWAEGWAHDFRVDGDDLFYFDELYGWEGIKIKYCPFCGKPLTEEAWAVLERRIEVER